ncbi:MAG TPA: biopolymer transporter ExbD [Kofleriaceae bacterium]|nr:biopolymer transporter ExbD [Kofleriaceae bacterium]
MAMKAGGDGELNAEINVTPLVDVMLVLLIIFMITAPLMNNTGVQLDLPQVSAQNIEDPAGKLPLSIKADKTVYLGGTQVTWTDLKAKLQANERVKKESELYIEADGKLPYEVVVAAMAIAKDAGVQKVMMLTDPSKNLTPADLDKNIPKPPTSP